MGNSSDNHTTRPGGEIPPITVTRLRLYSVHHKTFKDKIEIHDENAEELTPIHHHNHSRKEPPTLDLHPPERMKTTLGGASPTISRISTKDRKMAKQSKNLRGE
ncbi:hypothetical protein F2Q70_00010658 [Brassica cretica]|uniref:DET1- and DDB1-associated protein 1 n=1 Tax=Brassica cretica TaxID=69181 RepID=A0A3N6PNF0_BRACR|nr:hypothetical protein F2Q70_00010658 [Brassica cretica]KAF3545396.1 hypothetical protein DY000_02005533 [Brassica cretica]